MNIWQRVRSWFGGSAPNAPQVSQSHPAASPRITPPPDTPPDNDEPEVVVPEISVEELQQALAQATPPLLIDVREPHEWRLVRMADARHVPMNDLPGQLDTLPRDRALVIFCAHGSRSYSVAAWLIEQGYQAMSLDGGITAWASRGGSVEQG